MHGNKPILALAVYNSNTEETPKPSQSAPKNTDMPRDNRYRIEIEWIRSTWKVGSKVDIYSRPSKQWVTGTIVTIASDKLTIEYTLNHGSLTQTLSQHDIQNIRPLHKMHSIYRYIHRALTPFWIDNLFCKHRDQCPAQTTPITDCLSAKRIKIILSKQSIQTILDIFSRNKYSNTHLLNDFNHIQYDHGDDDCVYADLFQYLTTNPDLKCDFGACMHYQRHQNRNTALHGANTYTIELISRIHTHCIHSYDTHRLTPSELTLIDDGKQIDAECYNQMKHKQQNASAQSDIDWKEIYFILQENIAPVCIQIRQLESAFGNYKSTDAFISDLITAYDAPNDCALDLSNGIVVSALECDSATRKRIYELILYKYFSKRHIKTRHLICMAENVMNKSFPQISLVQFRECLERANLDGRLFMKGTPQFMNSLAFGKIFESVEGGKKKHFAKIYSMISTRWNIKTRSAKVELIEYHKERSDVYEIGVKFFYWESVQHHPHYVKAHYCNLKEELLDNNLIPFDIQTWERLQNECQFDIKTDVVRGIISNGLFCAIYRIPGHRPFTASHLCALKIYINYTKESGLFCAALRTANTAKVAQIAHRARLLTETVQCYGTALGNRKYYRGVDAKFRFEGIATRFNLPTSTTVNWHQATNFSDNGLVLTLRKYGAYDTYKFDCYKLSAYSKEKETLFFGGNTVLKIASIWQHVGGKWIHHGAYMVPLHAIVRMIHGLSVTMENRKHQQQMLHLMTHIFHRFNAQQSKQKLPIYIENLLKYYVSNAVITLNFMELKKEYKWLHSLIRNTQYIDVPNICTLFADSDRIVFVMPNSYVLSDAECNQLIRHDLAEITNGISITFQWPLQSDMPRDNRRRIDQYRQHLMNIHWNRTYSPNSVCFECIESSESPPARPTKPIKKRLSLCSSANYYKKRISNVKLNMKDIVFSCFLTVKGFIYPTKIARSIQDCILQYYAQPIVMTVEYKSKPQPVLCCPITDNWRTITDKVMMACGIDNRTYDITSFKYGRKHVDRHQWDEFEWDGLTRFEPTFEQHNVHSSWSRASIIKTHSKKNTSLSDYDPFVKVSSKFNSCSGDSTYDQPILRLDDSYRMSSIYSSADSVHFLLSPNTELSRQSSAIDIETTRINDAGIHSFELMDRSKSSCFPIDESQPASILDHTSRELTMIDYPSQASPYVYDHEQDLEIKCANRSMPYKYCASLSSGCYGSNLYYDHCRQQYLNQHRDLREQYYKLEIMQQLEQSIPGTVSVDHIVHRLQVQKDPYAENVVVSNTDDEFCVPDLDAALSVIEKEHDWKPVLYDVYLYHHIERSLAHSPTMDASKPVHLNHERRKEWERYLQQISLPLPKDAAVDLHPARKIVDSIVGYHHFTIAVSHIIKVYQIFPQFRLSLAFIIHKRYPMHHEGFKRDIDDMFEQNDIEYVWQELDRISLNETIKTIFRTLGEYKQNSIEKSRDIMLLFVGHQSSACKMYIYDRSQVYEYHKPSTILPNIPDDHWKLFVLEYHYWKEDHVQCYWKIDGKALRFFPEHMETVWPKYFVMERHETNKLIYAHKYRHQFGVGLYDRNFCTLYYAVTKRRFLSTHYYREYRIENRLALSNTQMNVDVEDEADYTYFRAISNNECSIDKTNKVHKCTRIQRLVFILQKHERKELDELCSILKRCHVDNLQYIKDDIDHLIKKHATEFNDVYQLIFHYMVHGLKLNECKHKLKCWPLRRRTRSIHRVYTENHDEAHEEDNHAILRGILDRLHCDVFHRDPSKHFRQMFVDPKSILRHQTLQDFEEIVLNNVWHDEALYQELDSHGMSIDDLRMIKKYLKVDCLYLAKGKYTVDRIRIVEDICNDPKGNNIYKYLNKHASHYETYKSIIDRYVRNHYLQTAAVFRRYKIREEIFVAADKKDIKDLLQSEIGDMDHQSFDTVYETIRDHKLISDLQEAKSQCEGDEDVLFPSYDADNSDEWLSRSHAPHFATMKDELLKNSLSAMLKSDYVDTEIECQTLHENKESNIDIMSLQEIVALKVFTDYSDLQTAFSMAFYDSDRSRKKQRECEFYRWNLVLKQAMHYASRPLDWNHSTLWRGLKGLFHFQSFEPKAQQPTSFSLDRDKASAFCGDKGILLCASEAIGIPLRWLSNFGYEDEWWCFNTTFKLETIHIKTNDMKERVEYLRCSLQFKIPNNNINTFQFEDESGGNMRQYVMELLDFDILSTTQCNGLTLLQTIFFELKQYYILAPVWNGQVDDIECCTEFQRTYLLQHEIFRTMDAHCDSYKYREWIMHFFAQKRNESLTMNLLLCQTIADCIHFAQIVAACIDKYNAGAKRKITEKQKAAIIKYFQENAWNFDTFTESEKNEVKRIFIRHFRIRSPCLQLYTMIYDQILHLSQSSDYKADFKCNLDAFYSTAIKYKPMKKYDTSQLIYRLKLTSLNTHYKSAAVEYIASHQLNGTSFLTALEDEQIAHDLGDSHRDGHKMDKTTLIRIIKKSIYKHQSRYYSKKRKQIYYLDKKQIVQFFKHNEWNCATFMQWSKPDLVKTIFGKKLSIKAISAKKFYDIIYKQMSELGVIGDGNATEDAHDHGLSKLKNAVKQWQSQNELESQSIIDYKLKNYGNGICAFDLLIGDFELEFWIKGEPAFNMKLNAKQEKLLAEYPPISTLILRLDDDEDLIKIKSQTCLFRIDDATLSRIRNKIEYKICLKYDEYQFISRPKSISVTAHMIKSLESICQLVSATSK
eukprot:224991_1